MYHQVSFKQRKNGWSREVFKAFSAKLSIKHTDSLPLPLALKSLSEIEGSHIKSPIKTDFLWVMGYSPIQKLVEQNLIKNQVSATESLVSQEGKMKIDSYQKVELCKSKLQSSAWASLKVLPLLRFWTPCLPVCLGRLLLLSLSSHIIFLSPSPLASGYLKLCGGLWNQTIWTQISALPQTYQVTLGKYLTSLCLGHLTYKMGIIIVFIW